MSRTARTELDQESSMDITRTMPQTESPEWVANLFNGTWTEDVEFPFGQTVANVETGDFLYLIYQGRIHGRLRITQVEQGGRTVAVGTEEEPVNARTIVHVHCPGQVAPGEYPREAHRNHRYDGVPEWGQ